MKVSKVSVASVAAIVAAAVAAPAMALNAPSINGGTPVNTNLILGVFDSAGNSETINLGYSYSDLINATSTAVSGAFSPDSLVGPFQSAVVNGNSVLQLDFGTVSSNFTSLFTSPSTTQYSLIALNGSGTGELMTNVTLGTTGSMTGTTGDLNNFLAHVSGSPAVDPADPQNNNGDNFGFLDASLDNHLGGQVTEGAVGTALNFYSLVDGTSGRSSTTPNVVTEFGNATGNGFFLLGANGDLTWNLPTAGTSPVPLPAAAWLLISGLAGLGAIGRRRNSGSAALA